MSKSYSVTFQCKNKVWVTNWHQYFDLSNVDWNQVLQFAIERGYRAYGYQHGHNSRNLTSSRNRVVLWEAI